MIESTAIVRWVMLLLASAAWLIAIFVFVAALRADATIPPGQVNESILGYISAVFVAIVGAVFFSVYRIYRKDCVTSITKQ